MFLGHKIKIMKWTDEGGDEGCDEDEGNDESCDDVGDEWLIFSCLRGFANWQTYRQTIVLYNLGPHFVSLYNSIIGRLYFVLSFLQLTYCLNIFPYKFRSKVKDLNPTNDWESSEKSHCSSYCWKLIYKLCFSVFGYCVESRSIKVDPNEFQILSFHFKICK